MALTGYSLVTIYARQTTVKTLSTPVDVINFGNKQSYTDGTGNYQINTVYYYSGTLTPYSAVTFNLKDGSITDNFGQSAIFSRVKFFVCHNLSTPNAAYYYLGTSGDTTRSFFQRFVTGRLYNYAQGQLFFSAPKTHYVLGGYFTVAMITAVATTVSVRLVIAGTNE